MNVWEKLQAVRLAISKTKIKKTGKNTFTRYDYYTLDDLLPVLTKLLSENKLTTSFAMDKEMTLYRVIDAEKPEDVIEFTCPTIMATMKSASPIQELGSTMTYLHRYLVLLAFSICEPDWVEIDREERDKEKAKRKENNGFPQCEGLEKIMLTLGKMNYSESKINNWIRNKAEGRKITAEWLNEVAEALLRKVG